jgi:hypothetical protein
LVVFADNEGHSILGNTVVEVLMLDSFVDNVDHLSQDSTEGLK